MTKALLDHGANLNAKINYGFTPLHYVAMVRTMYGMFFCNQFLLTMSLLFQRGCLEVTRFLVEEASANVRAKDKDGKTPLQVARAEYDKPGQSDRQKQKYAGVIDYLESIKND